MKPYTGLISIADMVKNNDYPPVPLHKQPVKLAIAPDKPKEQSIQVRMLKQQLGME